MTVVNPRFTLSPSLRFRSYPQTPLSQLSKQLPLNLSFSTKPPISHGQLATEWLYPTCNLATYEITKQETSSRPTTPKLLRSLSESLPTLDPTISSSLET